jgi:hypothetical protein
MVLQTSDNRLQWVGSPIDKDGRFFWPKMIQLVGLVLPADCGISISRLLVYSAHVVLGPTREERAHGMTQNHPAWWNYPPPPPPPAEFPRWPH